MNAGMQVWVGLGARFVFVSFPFLTPTHTHIHTVRLKEAPDHHFQVFWSRAYGSVLWTTLRLKINFNTHQTKQALRTYGPAPRESYMRKTYSKCADQTLGVLERLLKTVACFSLSLFLKRILPLQNGAGKSHDAPLPGLTIHVSTAWPSRTYPITQV